VEFFVSNQCDASGHGEGTIFVGDYSHTTSATTGSLTFLDLRFISSEKSGFVTATATNTSRGDTSEFSACVPITAGAGPGGGGGGGDAAALLDAATGPTPFPPPTPPRPAGATLAAALTEPERRAVPVGAEPPRRAAAPRAEAEARDAVFAAPLPTLNVELL
jgi:hypothetical protein